MRRLRSFRLRIALLSAAISGTVLGSFGAATWFLIQRERVAALDREIRTLAWRHPGWMGGNASLERLTSSIEFVFGADRRNQLLLLVKDAGGGTLYQSPHWPVDFDPATIDLTLEDAAPPGHDPVKGDPRRSRGAAWRGPPWASPSGGTRTREFGGAPTPFSKQPRFSFVDAGNTVWRVGVLGNDRERMVLALDCADLRAELHRLRNGFLLALPVALALIGGGGWWIAGQALRPLRSITRVAEGMTAKGLDQRIPLSGEDPEIDRLIRVLNGMMDRLEASFRQATRFGADASHELKTPLAVMQGELEQALQTAVPGSVEQAVFANLLEETQRLKTITRGLLWLARADAGQLPLKLESVDLAGILAEMTEDMEALASPAGIRCRWELTAGIRVRGDATLLRQVLRNLLHNAVQYNEPDGEVEVRLGGEMPWAEVTVSNSGPGIPAADQDRLFDRFFRSDTARGRRVDGVGLGLSLAREITRAHGGVLSLEESRVGRTAFRLRLPREA